MTQYTSPPLPPPLPDGPAVAPDRVVPLLIGATVGEIERELVLQTLHAAKAPTPRRAYARRLCPHTTQQDPQYSAEGMDVPAHH